MDVHCSLRLFQAPRCVRHTVPWKKLSRSASSLGLRQLGKARVERAQRALGIDRLVKESLEHECNHGTDWEKILLDPARNFRVCTRVPPYWERHINVWNVRMPTVDLVRSSPSRISQFPNESNNFLVSEKRVRSHSEYWLRRRTRST